MYNIIRISLFWFTFVTCNPTKDSKNSLELVLAVASNANKTNSSISGSGKINIGGKVTGISNGNTATLLINDKDTMILTESKAFQNFVLNHPQNLEYKLEIKESKGITCTILNAIGKGTSDVTNINLTCSIILPSGTVSVDGTIGGTVTGLTGNITLSMTGEVAQTLAISANGSYQFPTGISNGKNFTVGFSAQSNTSFCFLPNANASNNLEQTGITTTSNTTNINVTCVGRITLNEIISTNTGGATCTGLADYIETKNISGGIINIGTSEWFLCDDVCGGTTFNSAILPLYTIPTQTFNNNAYLTFTQTTDFTFGLGNGDTVNLIYQTGGKNYRVESLTFPAHVSPARKSTDGNFTGSSNSGIWVQEIANNCTKNAVNP